MHRQSLGGSVKKLVTMGNWVLFSATVLFLAAAAGYAQTAKPDFVNGGQFGPTPSATPDQQVINKANRQTPKDIEKPQLLDCEEDYEVDISITQEVPNCEKTDYQKLYDQAKEMADQDLKKMECPPKEACSIPYTWYGYWHWGCVDETHAIMEVQEFKSCQKPNAKMSIGVSDGSSLPKNAPQSIGTPPPGNPPSNGEFITQATNQYPYGSTLDCDSGFTASYVYNIQTPFANALQKQMKGDKNATAMSTIKNFEPFYNEAVQKAKQYHDSFKCKQAPGVKCVLQPFAVSSGDIQCDGTSVTITLYFKVKCGK